MTVIGTVEEINNVLQCINPEFPEQHLENIESGECCYVMNGVTVTIIKLDDS